MPQWLVLSWALMFGYQSDGLTAVYNGNHMAGVADFSGSYYTSIALSGDIVHHLRIFGEVNTSMDYIKGSGAAFYNGCFAPFEAYYICGIALHSGGWELGCRHECDHGVLCSSRPPQSWIGTSSTLLYVKVDGSL